MNLRYEGDNGAGDVNGTAFSNESWIVQVVLDDTVADTDPIDPSIGLFPGAIQAAYLTIGLVTYEMSVNSATTSIETFNFLNYNHLRSTISPTASVNLVSGAGGVFPPAASDHNNLSTLVDGAIVDNSLPNFLAAASVLNFSSALTVDSDIINIVEASPSGSGSMILVVPESTSAQAVGMALVIGVLISRRRESA